MKFLIIKDPHSMLGFRSNYRKSGWENDMINKHKFIINYAKENHIKYILSTGDNLDNQKQWSFKQYLSNKKLFKMYRDNDLVFASIAGNHDMLEGRIDIKDSVFENLVQENFIYYITENPLIFSEFMGSDKIKVLGKDYQYINDKKSKQKFIDSIEIQDKDLINILIMHQNITPKEERVSDFTYKELVNIGKEKNINIFICGHYHIGFNTTTIDGITIINPWNLWRVVRDYEVQMDNHKPEMVELLITGEDEVIYKHIEIPHKDYLNAFDPKLLDIFKETKIDTFNFFKAFKSDDDLLQGEEKTDIEILEIMKNTIKEKFNTSDEEILEAFKEIESKLF